MLTTHPHPTLSHWTSLPWQEAPHWAHWAAMDRTGNWFWYEAEPRDEDGYFTVSTGRIVQFAHLPYPTHWRLSLQYRPQAPSFFFSSAEVAYALLHA